MLRSYSLYLSQKKCSKVSPGWESRLFTRAKNFKNYPFIVRICGFFCLGAVVGAITETFVCKTHLYEVVMYKKDFRRHDIDEQMLALRGNILKWQAQDKMLEMLDSKDSH